MQLRYTLPNVIRSVTMDQNAKKQAVAKAAISYVENDSIVFPVNEKAGLMYKSGIWIKLTNWDADGKTAPLLNSERRGRITQDFKVAPFFEHVKENEFEY